MRNDCIVVQGAREHNLKNLTLTIPKYRFVVLTGPSGSGKSTLALDTLQRECLRQYLESLGLAAAAAYGKPKVDAITGLSPSISIGQHQTNRNPRSTVGTVTDLYTYLRILFEQLGQRPCPHCGRDMPAIPREEEAQGNGRPLFHAPIVPDAARKKGQDFPGSAENDWESCETMPTGPARPAAPRWFLAKTRAGKGETFPWRICSTSKTKRTSANG